MRDHIIVPHSSRTVHDHQNIHIVNPISRQCDTRIECNQHIVHIGHSHIRYSRHLVPMPAHIPLVSIPKLACPAWLNVTELITPVPRDKVIVITAIVLKVDPIPTDLCASIGSSVIGPPRAGIPHFYLAGLCASVPGGIVPVITLIVPPVYAVPTDLIAKVSLVVVAPRAVPAIFHFTNICAAVSVCIGKSGDVYFYGKVVVISNC